MVQWFYLIVLQFLLLIRFGRLFKVYSIVESHPLLCTLTILLLLLLLLLLVHCCSATIEVYIGSSSCICDVTQLHRPVGGRRGISLPRRRLAGKSICSSHFVTLFAFLFREIATGHAKQQPPCLSSNGWLSIRITWPENWTFGQHRTSL